MASSYLAASRSGLLDRRIKESRQLLEKCVLCPRRCKVDRLAKQTGLQFPLKNTERQYSRLRNMGLPGLINVILPTCSGICWINDGYKLQPWIDS
jgi:hypothetical protein